MTNKVKFIFFSILYGGFNVLTASSQEFQSISRVSPALERQKIRMQKQVDTPNSLATTAETAMSRSNSTECMSLSSSRSGSVSPRLTAGSISPRPTGRASTPVPKLQDVQYLQNMREKTQNGCLPSFESSCYQAGVLCGFNKNRDEKKPKPISENLAGAEAQMKILERIRRKQVLSPGLYAGSSPTASTELFFAQKNNTPTEYSRSSVSNSQVSTPLFFDAHENQLSPVESSLLKLESISPKSILKSSSSASPVNAENRSPYFVSFNKRALQSPSLFTHNLVSALENNDLYKAEQLTSDMCSHGALTTQIKVETFDAFALVVLEMMSKKTDTASDEAMEVMSKITDALQIAKTASTDFSASREW